MAEATGQVTQFPSQSVDDATKSSMDYGMEVARGIQNEWFRKSSGTGRFAQNQRDFHKLRLYARGEQSVQKYKDEFSVNGDLSYLNLDWTPVPIIPKFVDIVVNGMQDRLFKIKAFAQDPTSVKERTDYVDSVQEDILAEDFIENMNSKLGIDTRNEKAPGTPKTTEELELHMQIGYKPSIEIAHEQAMDNVFQRNNYPELKKRLDYDQAVLGIACAKHTFNNTDGIKLEYVDPSNLVYSYTEDPNFEDVYYFGEIKQIKTNELKKEFPGLSNEKFDEIVKTSSNYKNYDYSNNDASNESDSNTVTVMYFNWKSWEKSVYKIKETSTGASKAIKKDDKFDPPKDQRTRFEKVAMAREVIYEGVMALGSNELLKWEKASNMVRPDANASMVMMNYVVSAPRMYKGKISSLVGRMITYADLIQLTHLKLQQTIQRMTPSGVYLDADGLAEIDLGNGTNYNPQEALNMYFQTGSVIGRSMTVDGEMNAGKVPIQELPGGGGQQSQMLIQAYNYYLNMIRDVTGLNEARDGSDPDQYALLGVQKLAAANSNTATRHILHSSLYITATLAEAISVRIKDVLEFHPQRDAFIGGIGRFSVGALQELNTLYLHDFGIFLELEPDQDEKQLVENNIQIALSKDQIHLEDVIDIRRIKNVKLANELLKHRRNKKIESDQARAEANIKAQSEANGKAAQTAEMAKAQAEQIKAQSKVQVLEAQTNFDIKKVEHEAITKRELMKYEFELNVKLKEMELQAKKEIAGGKLTDSDITGPPSSAAPQKSFESKGNDVLGDIDMSRFGPS
jgi:hypothetical protein|tara:strand:+ start:421 stop:2805 length:2385 start_codon:yes stop_codon:yes gene_type:complete